MDTRPRCRECGDTKPLNRSGVCSWRHGCEHRQMVHEARMGQLTAALALNDAPSHTNCGCTMAPDPEWLVWLQDRVATVMDELVAEAREHGLSDSTQVGVFLEVQDPGE